MKDLEKYKRLLLHLNSETGTRLLKRNMQFREQFIRLQTLLRNAVALEQIPDSADSLVNELDSTLNKYGDTMASSCDTLDNTLEKRYPNLNCLVAELEEQLPTAAANIRRCLETVSMEAIRKTAISSSNVRKKDKEL